MAQETLYFSHDYNPFEDMQFDAMVGMYGITGYGVFWRLVEMLHANADHALMFDNGLTYAIANKLHIEETVVEEVIGDCIHKYHLIQAINGLLYSNRVNKNVLLRQRSVQQRVDAGKASAEQRKRDKEDAELFRELQRSLTVVDESSTKKERKKDII